MSHFLLKTDNDNLFVPSAIHFEIIYLRPNQPAVVPCRVTHPQAKVSLHREVPPEEIPTNNTLVSYDPTKGFVLQSPSKEHEGVFYCKAETRGTPQISTKYQLLYVEGNEPRLGCQLTSVRVLTRIISVTVPSGAPYVSLEVSPESVTGGDDVNVTCTVLGEPEEDVSFSWVYPGQVNTELGSKAKPSPSKNRK